MFFENIAIIYDSNIFEYSQLFESLRLRVFENVRELSVVREFATGKRDARRHFWRERLRILMNTSSML